MILGDSHGPLKIVGFLGFCLFFVGILSMFFTGACLSCDQSLGRIFSNAGGSPWKISDDLRFCPYCGHSLDNLTNDNEDT